MGLHLRAEKIKFEREYAFHPSRRWRFDFAIPDRKLAIEIEGLMWGEVGRHQRPEGYMSDCRKYNEAQLLGWVVLRFTHGMVESAEAIDTVKKWLAKK